MFKTTGGYIAGGFSSVSWASIGSYVNDPSAFLYTLVNPNNMPLKLAITSSGNALYDQASYGPTFGGGHDLHISDVSNTNTNSYAYSYNYQYPNGNSGYAGGIWMLGVSNFQLAEVEVFLVT